MPTTEAPALTRPHGALSYDRPYEEPNVATIRYLYKLLLEAESRWINGPWDSWDGAVLAEWRRAVRQQIVAAEMALECRLDALESLNAAVHAAKGSPDAHD